MRRQGLAGWLHNDVTHRGVTAWLVSGALISFYLILYFQQTFDQGRRLDLLAQRIFAFLPESYEPTRWTLYGGLYSLAIVSGGLWMLWKYRHNRYQVIRTLVVMFVQVSFGFSVPILLKIMGQPEYYFTYFWPLKFDYFLPQTIINQPLPFVLYSFLGSLVLVPVMTLLYGKRWYCSWVCGCGGLANTFGEPWRHLSQKSQAAWNFEKVSIHTVVALSLVVTSFWALGHFAESEVRLACGLGSLWGAAAPAECVESLPPGSLVAWYYGTALYGVMDFCRRYYGIIVLSVLSGVVGTGLYPLGGTRLWCRYFCPMAGFLGMIQKLGRFRIRVKKEMCISCGLCTEYCEMGIDVRAYAQAGRSFTRASCVGCGLCAEVCPRGVLRLENEWKRDPSELTMSSFLDQSWKY
jgi:ferredoxin-type protein NapH